MEDIDPQAARALETIFSRMKVIAERCDAKFVADPKLVHDFSIAIKKRQARRETQISEQQASLQP